MAPLDAAHRASDARREDNPHGGPRHSEELSAAERLAPSDVLYCAANHDLMIDRGAGACQDIGMSTPSYEDLERMHRRLIRLRKASRRAQQKYYRMKIELEQHRRATWPPGEVDLVSAEFNGRRGFAVTFRGTVVGSVTKRSSAFGDEWTCDLGTYSYYSVMDAVWAVLDDTGTTEEIERAERRAKSEQTQNGGGL